VRIGTGAGGEMYLDSCILVKLITPEPDTGFFAERLTNVPLTSSELALTEVWSALLAKERTGKITRPQRERAWRSFTNMIGDQALELNPLQGVVLRKANHQLERCHPLVALRTLDAIHLAACDLTQDFPLCTTDERLRQAAALLKIPLFPENRD
jgi:predicted nucleic acid-binding protein